jgi:hypothetical protein
MTEWNKDKEQLIRDFGEYIDKLARTALDPEVGTMKTLTRLFGMKSTGETLVKRMISDLGCEFDKDWSGALDKVIKLAEDNGSDAAAKIKKILPQAKLLAQEFGIGPGSEKMGKIEQLKKLGELKKRNIKFD